MQLWYFLCLTAGMSWSWCTFTVGRKLGAPWSGFAMGLAVGVGCFWVMKTFGVWVIRRLKLGETKPPVGRLFLSWLLCFAAAVIIFAASWVINWAVRLFFQS